MSETLLTIIVPCFNEEDVLPETVKRLKRVLNDAVKKNLISEKSNMMFVDDGSKDRTWEIISGYARENESVTGLKLSRNFGHQKALIAGMETARLQADCIISIDADLQDDVDVISDFLTKYHEGYDVVYGVRDKRETDSFFKRSTALGFYKMMEKLGVDMVPNHADFRLLSKRALDEFVKYQEENVFIRCIVPLLGFKSAKVYYNRSERFAGKSKYPLKKMLNFAIDGLTSFSVAPMRLVAYLGCIFFVIGLIMIVYILVQHFSGHAVTGWSSIILSIWLIGGVQLIAMGIIGEYVGKIFNETKHRPRYSIERDLYTDKIEQDGKKDKVLMHLDGRK